MAPTNPVSVARVGVSATLRWFTSAVALVDRPDREQALLERYEDLPARLQALEQHAAALHLVLVDPPSEKEFDKEGVEQSLRDVDQAYEMADTLSQRVREIKAAQRGESVVPQGVKKTPATLLGRLPTLDLPTFEGDLSTWMGFLNLFDSLVHSREDLSPSQKLAYLRSALRGEASALVQHLIINDENYEVARALLTSRYQNVRLLADTHVAAILALPRVTRATSLRRDLLNPLLSAINTLKRLGLPVDDWSFILLHLILSKLPVEMKGRFEQKYGGIVPLTCHPSKIW